MMDIIGKTALVTGANRGLGRAFAGALLEAGASKVYAGARDPSTVSDPRLMPIRLDVTSSRDVAAISDATEPIGPNEIAAAAGMKATNVRQLLRKLVKEGTIFKADYGRYTTTATATPITRSHSRSHSEQALEGTEEPKV
jgi:NAD(P)-dependent dehydrogenase (short-subunit alcohol dehydrogenase family)